MRITKASVLIIIIALLCGLSYVFGHSFHQEGKQAQVQAQKKEKQGQLKQAKVSETSLTIDGKKAPRFTLSKLDGKTVSLADYKGKPLLLVTWATWCKECHSELLSLQKTKSQNLPYTIVLINMSSEETSLSDVKHYLDKNHLNLPVLLDQKGDFEKAYRVQVIPTSILIDSYGNVLHTFYGPVSLATIDKWLPTA